MSIVASPPNDLERIPASAISGNWPWRAMLATNVVIMMLVFVYKYNHAGFDQEYSHLLVTYNDGMLKRAFIGEVVSLFTEKVSLLQVFALGVGVWITVLCLFLAAFHRTIGFSEATLPLLVMTFGSPFFLKNFIQTLGYFDIYGCVAALMLLLIPARTFAFVALAGLLSILLLLIHHIHFFLYLPTICVVVALRYFSQQPASRREVMATLLVLLMVGATLLYLQFFGNARLGEEAFAASLYARIADPSYDKHLVPTAMWFSTLPGEFAKTWSLLPGNISRFPAYIALTLLHWPLIKQLVSTIKRLACSRARQVACWGLGFVSAAYLVIFIVASDYSRWVASWGTCMIVLLLAAKTLPARTGNPVAWNERAIQSCGWVVTLIPRIGVMRPF